MILNKQPRNQRRFFYHYNKHNKKMSIHFKKMCYIVNDIICEVPCETKWSETQPQLVMRGFCKEVNIVNEKAFIR